MSVECPTKSAKWSQKMALGDLAGKMSQKHENPMSHMREMPTRDLAVSRSKYT